MRIRIDYTTRYNYLRPARSVIQMLRLTPRSHEGQQVLSWGIETDVNTILRATDDAFGNVVHHLYTDQPTQSLSVRVAGEVETSETGGVLRGVKERLDPLVYLRDTALTEPDRAIRDLAMEIAVCSDPLDRMHRLMNTIHDRVRFEVGATDASHTAAQALAVGRGVCQDHAHIFIAASRRLDVPARYVSGHLRRDDGQDEQDAAHAWAEAHIDGLGWVGFDAANGVCPTEAYVRVASGPDYLRAAPVRGSTLGAGGETLSVNLRVREVGLRQQQQ